MSENPRYERLEEIGQGELGTVWRGRDLVLGVEVAIKVLNDAVRNDPQRLQHVLEGASYLARLAVDEYFVRVLDVDAERGWLVLEYMPSSMARRLSQGAVAADFVRDVLREALAGLSALHAGRRLHGHIKPGNLLISGNGDVKLSEAPLIELAPKSGEMRRPEGLPKYLAPELIDPTFGAVTPAADLYSLGFTALELLVGPTFDTLFRGTGSGAADPELGWLRLHGSREEPLPTVKSVVKSSPPDLARVIDKMLSRDVASRYSSADDALRDLGGPPTPHEGAPPTFDSGDEPVPPPPTKRDPATLPVAKPQDGKKGPWWKSKAAIYGGAFFVLVAAIGGMMAFMPTRDEDRTVAVRIESDPPGAKIFVDGNLLPEDKFKTPADLPSVKAVKRKFKVELAGYPPQEQEIDLAAVPEKTIVKFEFVKKGKIDKEKKTPPEEVAVSVKSRPEGAEVLVNDKSIGKTPLTTKLKPDAYAVRFVLAGHVELKTTWDLTAGKPREFDYPLTPKTTELPKEIANSLGMKLRLIPALPDGGPLYVGTTEVTQSQYEEVMGVNPSRHKASSADSKRLYPVDGVTYRGAVEFCLKLTQKEKETGRTYRLPTKAEWEHACRAGTKTKYHSGDTEKDLDEVGWWKANAQKGKPSIVARKKENDWGLFDMHGNLREWCSDEVKGEELNRLLLGGAYDATADKCTATSALPSGEISGSATYGIRVVCVPMP